MSLRRFLDKACATRGGATFLHAGDREWTYAEMGAITDGLAAELIILGLRPGERVAMMMPGGPEHLFAWLAVVKLGAIACPIHADLSSDETAAIIEHLEPSALIHDVSLESKALTLGNPMPGIRIVSGLTVSGSPGVVSLVDLLASRRPLEGAPEPQPEDVADILATSGTTGKPKAAMIPHRMAVLTGEAFAHWLGLSRDDRLFTCLPFSHINARLYSTLGAIASGGSLAIEPKFSASRFWNWIASSEATQFNAIGAMLRILLERPGSSEDRGHGIRLVYSAPALGHQAHLRFERRFGVRLVIGYGLTESTFGFIHPLTGPRNLDSMGRPRRHPDPSLGADVRIVVEDPVKEPAETRETRGQRFRDAGLGETGEIWLRNPATFSGYFRDEAATRAVFDGDWLRTGDLARRNGDGNYVFAGRLKQVIRRRGENLTPAEVEAVIESHAAVLEAAVIGVPSPLGEEEVRAYVALKPGAAAGVADLISHCAARLASFKIPTEWRFLDRLPRTPTGRVAYQKLPQDDLRRCDPIHDELSKNEPGQGEQPENDS